MIFKQSLDMRIEVDGVRKIFRCISDASLTDVQNNVQHFILFLSLGKDAVVETGLRVGSGSAQQSVTELQFVSFLIFVIYFF